MATMTVEHFLTLPAAAMPDMLRKEIGADS